MEHTASHTWDIVFSLVKWLTVNCRESNSKLCLPKHLAPSSAFNPLCKFEDQWCHHLCLMVCLPRQALDRCSVDCEGLRVDLRRLTLATTATYSTLEWYTVFKFLFGLPNFYTFVIVSEILGQLCTQQGKVHQRYIRNRCDLFSKIKDCPGFWSI